MTDTKRMSERPKKGDWIRFRLHGRLVIGEVAYIAESRFYHEGEWIAMTDLGTVNEKDALEVRHSEEVP